LSEYYFTRGDGTRWRNYKDVAKEDTMRYIFGYTNWNDMSAREMRVRELLEVDSQLIGRDIVEMEIKDIEIRRNRIAKKGA
jgi:hypothetical protein